MNAVGLAGEHTWMSQSCSLIARMSCHERTPAAELSFFERGYADGEHGAYSCTAVRAYLGPHRADHEHSLLPFCSTFMQPCGRAEGCTEVLH